MKFIVSLLFLSLTLFLNARAQNSAPFAAQSERNYAAAAAENLRDKILPAASAAIEKIGDETATKETAAPLPQATPYVRPSKEARFKRYASDAFGVPALIGSTFGAGVSQISNDPPEWKRTASGYGKRFASAYGTNAIRNTISYGLSEALRLDNRFEKRGRGSFGKRLKHVFLGSYTTRTPSGRRLPDFPHFVGTYSASIIANETWLPDRFSYKDGLRDGTISLGVRFGVNLLREFVFPR